jgi:Rrf2 family transcriptional regulator, nitric oxide-sensitive transcriptional repressor
MISRTAEYALRAAIALAQNPHAPLTCLQISEITRISHDYLSKVLHSLARAGIVSSQRGKHGGFALVSPPNAVSLLSVISAVDPIRRIHTCPLELKSHAHTLCSLHRRLDQALAAVETAFSETSLADLLAEPSSVPALCEVSCAGVARA